jgi:hypothetical protein
MTAAILAASPASLSCLGADLATLDGRELKWRSLSLPSGSPTQRPRTSLQAIDGNLPGLCQNGDDRDVLPTSSLCVSS